MNVKVLVNEKNTLELELVGMDQSLAQLIAERLNTDSSVEFAAFKLDHPIIASPKLYLRTKKADPSKVLVDNLEELKKDLSSFREKFSDISD